MGEVAPEDPVEVARVSRHHLAQDAFLVLAEIEAQLAVSPDQLSVTIEPLGGARDPIELIEIQRKVRVALELPDEDLERAQRVGLGAVCVLDVQPAIEADRALEVPGLAGVEDAHRVDDPPALERELDADSAKLGLQQRHIVGGDVVAGRGAGARPGDWALQLVESADIVDDRVSLLGLHGVEVKRDERSEAHLLQPYDILVTARSQAVKVALVPPTVTGTVASVTLLVVRTPDPGTGLAHFLWYYLSSGRGRAELASRLTATPLPTLSVTDLGDVPVPVPPPAELSRMANLIEATEVSRNATIEAGRVRHDVLRDAIIAEVLVRGDG